MASRSGKRTLEDQSWTESPAAAVAVVLVTVPDTVTLPLGVAYVGLTDVIVTDSGWAGLACPGPAGRAGPALDAAAGATDRAATTTPAARATRARGADRRAAGWPPVPCPGRAGRRPPDVRHSRGMPKCYCGRAGTGAPEGMSWCRRPSRFPPGHPYPLPSMPVPDSHDLTPEQRRAAAALLRETAAPVAGLARLFTRRGHELALVGGSVRDVFLGRGHGDLDLTTDARPGQVLKLVEGWADAVWEIGIDFGTVGLRKGSTICEITTYRSESYRYDSRKPKV